MSCYGSCISDFCGDTVAEKMTAFIEEANSCGGNKELHFPPGEYDIPAGVIGIVTAPNVNFTGHAAQINAGVGPIFRYGDGSDWCSKGRVSDFSVAYTGADNTSRLMRVVRGEQITLEKIRINGGGYIFDGGELSPGHSNSNIRLLDITGSVDNIANTPVIRRGRTYALYIDGMNLYNKVGSGASEPYRVWLDDKDGQTSTLQLTNCLIERFFHGIDIYPPAGTSIIDIYMSNVVIDSCYSHAFVAYADGAGAQVNSVEATNCWFSSLSGNLDTRAAYFAALNGAQMSLWDLTGCKWYGGEKSAIYGAGNLRSFSFNGGQTFHFEQPDAGAAGIELADINGAMEDIAIRNMLIESEDPGSGVTNYRADYGVFLSGAHGSTVVENNTIGGNIAPVFTPGFVNASKRRRIRNNTISSGSSYGGWKGYGVYALPPSGIPWTNTTPFTTEIIVTGGSVYSIFHSDGAWNSVTGLTSGRFTVYPGESLTIYYGSSPYMRFKVIE